MPSGLQLPAFFLLLRSQGFSPPVSPSPVMSLINDALKKSAEAACTGDAPPLASMPSIGGEPAARIAKRAKPAGFNALLIRIGLISGGVIALLVGGYFVMRGSGHAPATTTTPVAGVADPGSLPASPRPATPAPANPAPATTPAVTFNLPIAPAPARVRVPEKVPAATVAEVKPAPVAEPVVPPPAPVVAKPAAPPQKLDTKAVNFIEGLRIAGIRASTTDSKVLMNDRVYRIGDIVEHDMGLKLVGITSNSLTFENEGGARYTRTF